MASVLQGHAWPRWPCSATNMAVTVLVCVTLVVQKISKDRFEGQGVHGYTFPEKKATEHHHA